MENEEPETEWEEGPHYQGNGGTLEAALKAAAEAAVADSRDNLGKKFEVVRHSVIVDNPRISQHRVVISATEP